MFYRVTRYEYAEDKQDEIVDWIGTITDRVREIEGLVAVDVFGALPGESVIVASYEDEPAFEAASGTVMSVLGELGQFLSGPPETLSGSPFWTTRAA